jgi:hypothetical protein
MGIESLEAVPRLTHNFALQPLVNLLGGARMMMQMLQRVQGSGDPGGSFTLGRITAASAVAAAASSSASSLFASADPSQGNLSSAATLSSLLAVKVKVPSASQLRPALYPLPDEVIASVASLRLGSSHQYDDEDEDELKVLMATMKEDEEGEEQQDAGGGNKKKDSGEKAAAKEERRKRRQQLRLRARLLAELAYQFRSSLLTMEQ